LFGVQQEDRFFESEHGDLLCVVSPYEVSPRVTIDELVDAVPLRFDGIANQLSPSMQVWDIIPAIETATKEAPKAQKMQMPEPILREPSQESKEVILNRRSIHVMDKERSRLSHFQFKTLMQSVAGPLDGKQTTAHLVMFVHQVEDLEPGIYILVRNSTHMDELKAVMHSSFAWSKTVYEGVYLLEEGDFKAASKAISCSQEIASDGAFSLGMLCHFSQQLDDFGAHRYKELYWECGAIGQQLYVEATSMKLSGTGIGCFLDDMFHELLGLTDNRFQSLYHFTVGRGYVDSRIMTQPAYEKE
jgi:nitroreductase